MSDTQENTVTSNTPVTEVAPAPTPRTVDEIAESMIVKAKPAPSASEVQADPAPSDDGVSGVTSEQGTEIEEKEDSGSSTVDQDLPQDDSDDDDSQLVGEEEDSDPLFSNLFTAEQERVEINDEGDTLDTSKLGEDVKFSVTVDGEEQTVSLGDLKQRYAGEGAIEKRVQEATEARTAAFADYDKSRKLTEMVLQEFGQALFRRTVPMPDENMLDVDPASYLRQKNMYEQEGASLQNAHSKLHGMMQQLDTIDEGGKAQRRQHAAQELRKLMPVFNHPHKGPKVREAIVEAAQELGYTREEIAACEDPRLFKAVALAARELKRGKASRITPVKETARSLKGKGTRNRPVTSSQQKQERDAFATARKSGTVDDVANTMIVKAPKRRGRR